MNITWKCDKCGQPLTTDGKHIGAKVECPRCKKSLVVPSNHILQGDKKLAEAKSEEKGPPPVPTSVATPEIIAGIQKKQTMTSKQAGLGCLVFLAGSIILAGLKTAGIRLGGLPAAMLMLAFLFVFSKAIGWSLFRGKRKE